MRHALFILLLLAAGCATEPDAPVATYSPAEERAWANTVACWSRHFPQAAGVERPQIIEHPGCLWSEREGVGYWEYAPGLFCTGRYYPPALVEVCPDRAALYHEFAHHLSFALRGVSGENGEGLCGL